MCKTVAAELLPKRKPGQSQKIRASLNEHKFGVWQLVVLQTGVPKFVADHRAALTPPVPPPMLKMSYSNCSSLPS